MRKLLLLLMLLPVAAMAADGDRVIVQKGRAFRPGEVTISRGESLTFTNEDSFIHQVYVDGMFDSEEKGPGRSLNRNLSARRHLPGPLSHPSHHALDCACEIALSRRLRRRAPSSLSRHKPLFGQTVSVCLQVCRMALAKHTIGAKIFGAFVAMSAMIGLMGLAGYGVLVRRGRYRGDDFRRPADGDQLCPRRADRFHGNAARGIALRTCRAGRPRRPLPKRFPQLATTFDDDLEVAAQRSLEADEQRMIAQIRPLMKRWREVRARGDIAELEKLDKQIDEKFDLLIEYNTGHSFIGRRKTVDQYRQLQICQRSR